MNSKKNILKNFSAFLFSDIVILLFGLLSRTLFIKTIGDYFLGITAVLNSIIGLLALSNLGLGDAIVYCLVKEISQDSKEEIRAIFNYSKKIFRMIILILIIASIMIIPLITFFVPDILDFKSFVVYYVFFVLSKVLTYQVGPYNSVIRADQKIRIIQKGNLLGYVVSTILQIVAMLFGGSYLIYVIFMLLGTLITNIYIVIYFKKEYKWVLINSKTIDQDKKMYIYNKVKDVSITRISSTLIEMTDNFLISKFIGTVMVGYYSNYMMIIQNIKSLAKNLYNSMESSIGVYVTKINAKDRISLYKRVLFLYHLIGSVLAVGVGLLMQDFIIIWIGKKYLLSKTILYALIIDLYLNILTYAQTGFINTTDVLKKIKSVYFFGAIINVMLSLIFVIHFGLFGIILGTLISRMVCNFPLGIYYLCKDQFEVSFNKILILNVKYIILFFIVLLINNSILLYFKVENFVDFVFKGILIVLLTVIINVLFCRNNIEIKLFKNKFKEVLHKLKF